MGVFDFLPGVGGDGDVADAEASAGDERTDADEGADDATSAADSPAAFRERAEELAARSDVPTLDFTVESLTRLDDLAAGPPSPVDDELAYGSYLGETIVRTYDAEWTETDGWEVAVTLEDERTTLAVFDAAEMSVEDQPLFEKIANKLDASGAVPAGGRDDGAPGDDETAADEWSVDAAADGDVTDDGESAAGDATAEGATAEDDVTSEDDESAADDGDGSTTEADDGDDETAVDSRGTAESTTAVGRDAAETSAHGPGDGDSGGAGGDDDPDAAEADDAADDEQTTADTEPVADEQVRAGRESDGADADQATDDGGETHTATEGDENEAEPNADVGSGPGADDEAGSDAGPDSGDDDPESADGDAPAPGGAAATATDWETETSTESATDETAPDRASASAAEPGDGGEPSTSAEPETAEGSVAEGASTAPEADASEGTDASEGVGADAETATESEGDRVAESETVVEGDAPASAESEGEGAVEAESEREGSVEPEIGVENDEDARAVAPEGAASDETESGSSPATAGEPGADPQAEAASESTESEIERGAESEEADGASREERAGERTANRGQIRVRANEFAMGLSVHNMNFSPASVASLDRAVDEELRDALAVLGEGDESEGVTEATDEGGVDGPADDRGATDEPADRGDGPDDEAGDGGDRPASHDAAGADALDWAARADLVRDVGAYYGEVLVRQVDGEWDRSASGDLVVAFPDDEAVEPVGVGDAVRAVLDGPTRFVHHYDALRYRLGRDDEPLSDGRGPVADLLGEGTVESASASIPQILAAAEAFVAARPDRDLDYSPASLGRVDDLVRSAWSEYRGVEAPLGDPSDPESLALTARTVPVGAYFAAVLVRAFDAKWRFGDGVALFVDGPEEGATAAPFAIAADALRGDESLAEAYEILRTQLDIDAPPAS